MNALEELYTHAEKIEAKIGYPFKDRHLLFLAFVHCSFVNENRDLTPHNERLEFLGDSVLGLIAANYLYAKLPHKAEGELSYLRSRLVEASSCITFMKKLQVDSYLLLGKGEKLNDGRGRSSILADLFEALIGALFLDGGLQAATEFFLGHFVPEIEIILQEPTQNWKARLQDICQKQFQQIPLYSVALEEGPDHNKSFVVEVSIQGMIYGSGAGPSKKLAQQAAAEVALKKLDSSSSADDS